MRLQLLTSAPCCLFVEQLQQLMASGNPQLVAALQVRAEPWALNDHPP